MKKSLTSLGAKGIGPRDGDIRLLQIAPESATASKRLGPAAREFIFICLGSLRGSPGALSEAESKRREPILMETSYDLI